MKRYQHILAPVDFSGLSQIIMDHAKDMAEAFGAKLTLLHVVQDVPMLGEPFGEPGAIILTEELEQQTLANAHEQMHTIIAQWQLSNPPQQLVEVGFPTDTILQVAQEQAVDLIIIGHSGKRGFLGFLGSTANDVVKSAKCDVLVVHPQPN